jgi:TRAP-type C4-dicarboxylate transport system substrate-binding protein
MSWLGLALVVCICGCTVPATNNKAGAIGEPVVLRLANTSLDLLSQNRAAADFIERVSALSAGQMRIEVINSMGGFAPDNEAQVVHAVASGRVDLGITGAGVFDSLGVLGLRAFSAPMLIDNYPLQKAVIESNLTRQMLEQLQSLNLSGLGVFAGALHVPVAVQRPLLGPRDWRGISFGTYRSETQEQAIRALGATPVEASGDLRRHYLDTGGIQGFEFGIHGYSLQEPFLSQAAPYITSNVVLWPGVTVLFANSVRLGSISAQDREWLQEALSAATSAAVGLAGRDDGSDIDQECALGTRFAVAAAVDIAGLQASFAVVYEWLDRDARTKFFIDQIQALKSSTSPGQPLAIPASCLMRS